MKVCLEITVQAFIVLLWIGQIAGTKKFNIPIGALFEHGQENLQEAFSKAIRDVNEDPNLSRNSMLVAKIETIADGDSFGASRKVCELLSQDVYAIFGPHSPETSLHVESVCMALKIPHIIVQLPHRITNWDSTVTRPSYTFNVAPHAAAYYKVFPEIVRKLKWNSFTIIYSDDAGLIRIKDLVSIVQEKSSNITAHKLPLDDDYRGFLLELQKQDLYNVIIDCSPNQTFRILKYAQQVGMMGEQYTYILTNTLDAEDKDFEDFRYSKSNILYTTLVNQMNPDLNQLTERNISFNTQMALLYGSVFFFAKLVSNILDPFLEQPKVSCETEKSWSNGSYVRAHMQTLHAQFLGGSIQLFHQHLSSFEVDIMKMENTGTNKVANYRIDDSNDSGVLIDTTEIAPPKTVDVVAILSKPYVMLKNNSLSTNNADIYEGYCIDIMEEISKIHGFRFNISLIHDNAYGYLHSTTGQFTGIIGELVKQNADIGIGDISITKGRHQVVDFSYPIMDVGIAALIRKYNAEDQTTSSVFYFLTPFSSEIWIALVAAYLGSCGLLFALARINHTEWHNPHRCATKSNFFINNLGFSNCLWIMLASLLRQWSAISPRGFSTRLVALVWWVFAITMYCFYMANLVKNQLLTVEELENPIRNIHDLLGQSKIKYGLIRGGSTMSFFRSSKIDVYQEMWSIMLAEEQNNPNQTPFVKTYEEGINRVKQGNYAFFMETPNSEFEEERDCSLMTVGPQMDHKDHGFAFPKGSPYREPISSTILKLQQTGILRKLKSKWWQHVKSHGHCGDDKLQKIKTINSSHLGGLFILLLFILPLACLIAVVEVICNWNRGNSQKKDNTLGQEILQQLTFAVNCKKITKTIPKQQIIEEERSSHLANEEENYIL